MSRDLASANPKKVSFQILLFNRCEEAIGIGDVETSLQILLGLNSLLLELMPIFLITIASIFALGEKELGFVALHTCLDQRLDTFMKEAKIWMELAWEKM